MKTILKGSLFVLAGLTISRTLEFAKRIIIVRSVSQADYGLFSLGFSIAMLAAMICGLGLYLGSQRYVAFYIGNNDIERAKGTAYSAVIISAVTSLIGAICLILLASPIANLLNKPTLSWVIYVMAFIIPAVNITYVVSGVYQGLENVTTRVYFRDMGISICTILAVILFHDNLKEMVTAFVIAYGVVIVGLVLYITVKYPKRFKDKKIMMEPKQLMLFSLPLAVTATATYLIVHLDTIMLGYFRPASQVGLYNAAVPIHSVLYIFIMAVAYIFAPVAARMVGEKNGVELKGLYSNVTKWLLIVTFPLFFLLLFYPSSFLKLAFGNKYLGVSLALQFLVIGEVSHIVMGPNMVTLIAYGKTRTVMATVGACFGLNIVLNLLLIPPYGVTGAAIATGVSLIAQNFLFSEELYRNYKINPFAKLKPALYLIAVGIVMYLPLKYMMNFSNWMLIPSYLILLAISIGVTIISKSIDEEDRLLYKVLRK
jgi:O-antigen/teichoic acid export membrane protein